MIYRYVYLPPILFYGADGPLIRAGSPDVNCESPADQLQGKAIMRFRVSAVPAMANASPPLRWRAVRDRTQSRPRTPTPVIPVVHWTFWNIRASSAYRAKELAGLDRLEDRTGLRQDPNMAGASVRYKGPGGDPPHHFISKFCIGPNARSSCGREPPGSRHGRANLLPRGRDRNEATRRKGAGRQSRRQKLLHWGCAGGSNICRVEPSRRAVPGAIR